MLNRIRTALSHNTTTTTPEHTQAELRHIGQQLVAEKNARHALRNLTVEELDRLYRQNTGLQ